MVWLPLHRLMAHGYRNTTGEMGLGNVEKFQWEILLGDTSVYLLFCLLFILSICANFRVIYVILARLSRARRQVAVYLLVLHLSFISLGILSLTLSNVVDILINFQGPILCRIIGFFKAALFCGFSTNMMAIVYQRVMGPLQSNRNHLLASRLIIIVWILPIFQGILDVFRVTSFEDEESPAKNYPTVLGNCVWVPLFGNDIATIINECFRFVTFHLVVTLYMAFALCKIWLSLNSLHKISPACSNHLQKKLQSIRYIVIHLGTFIIFWVPIGFFTFARRLITCGVLLFDNSQKDWLYKAIEDETSFLNKSIALSTLVYLTLNPIINLLLLDTNKVKVCPCKAEGFTVSTTSTPPVYESESGNAFRMVNLKESGSTVHATSRLPGNEKASSESSTSDKEECAANIVQAEVTVHAVVRVELENDAKAKSTT